MKKLLTIILIASATFAAAPRAAQAGCHDDGYYRHPASYYGAPVRYYGAPEVYGYPVRYYANPTPYYGGARYGYGCHRRPYYHAAPRFGFTLFFGH